MGAWAAAAGKFLELQFDKGGGIRGAAIRNYLLEKSRSSSSRQRQPREYSAHTGVLVAVAAAVAVVAVSTTRACVVPSSAV